MLGDIQKNTPISSYQPSQEVVELTKRIKRDYSQGVELLHKSWAELNNRTVLDDDQHGKMMFNAFVDTESADPNEEWKYKGTRSRARNKAITTHANLTERFLLPGYIAQNDDDEVDEGFSEVMRDGIEWMIQPNVSNYQMAFLQVTLSMLYSPIVYMSAEYYEAYQKNRKLDKEVLDEVLSGFQCQIWSCSQVLLANAFERNLQKQRFIIKRRYCEYGELKSLYRDNPNWKYVQKGIKSIYNDNDGLFYDIKDDEHPDLVAEEIWESRQEDLEIPLINGIYMGNGSPESKENAIKHRDNKNNPKYNIVQFGYSHIGENFVYYKSLMNCLQWENMKYDAMDELIMNRALLEVDLPIVVSGVDGEINSSIVFPKSVTTLENKDARISPLLPSSNLSAGFKVMEEGDKGLDDTSGINSTLEGQLPDASQKAYSVAQAQSGAMKSLKSVAKVLSESVLMFGDLMKDIFINHYTAAEVQEITGQGTKLKYRQLFLSSKDNTGNKVDKTIKFDSSLIGMEMSDDDKMKEGLRRLEQTKYKDGKEENIVWVNPEMFAKFKFLCKVDIEEMFSKGQEYWQTILLSLRQQLMNDPYIDMEKLDKELLYSYFQSKGDKFMKDQAGALGLPPEVLGQQPQPQPSTPVMGQVQNKQTANAVNNSIV